MSNTQLVQQAYHAFSQGDIPAVLGMLSADAEWNIPTIPNVDFSGPRRGPAGAGEFFAGLAAQQDALRFEPREFVAQDDQVVALGHYEWKVKATGKVWSSPFCHVFTVKDDKVVRFREYTDTAACAAAYV